MNVRLLTLATISALFICGCAQNGTPLPAGSAPAPENNAAVALRAPQPKLKFFYTPTSASWPDYIVSGPERSMWFSEFYADRIGRVTMRGRMTEFSLPYGTDIEGITVGADGNIWFTAPGSDQIGRMTPQGVVTVFPINAPADPRGITRGPDGNVWYVEFYDGYIGRVTPQGVITRFPVPDGPNAQPWAITPGPDGDLWFTESSANRIGRFDPRTQTFKPSLAVPTQYATPWGIIAAPDQHIWFTERTGDKIAEVVGGKIREFAIAQQLSYPETLAPGADGKLWFSEMQAGRVAAIDPRTGKFGKVIVLPSGSIPIGIAQGPNKNDWFCISSESQPMQIGELVFR